MGHRMWCAGAFLEWFVTCLTSEYLTGSLEGCDMVMHDTRETSRAVPPALSPRVGLLPLRPLTPLLSLRQLSPLPSLVSFPVTGWGPIRPPEEFAGPQLHRLSFCLPISPTHCRPLLYTERNSSPPFRGTATDSWVSTQLGFYSWSSPSFLQRDCSTL